MWSDKKGRIFSDFEKEIDTRKEKEVREREIDKEKE